MKLITRQSLADEAPQRWASQYSYYGVTPDKLEITSKLRELAKPVDPDKVDRITGNTTWTRVPSCDECAADVAAVMEIGQEPDYESNTARLCLACLQKAVAQMKAAKP